MKTKINHILPVLLLTAASGLTTVSCNDFLDKTPDNRTELNTDQKIAKLLVSAYPDVSPNELFELYSDNSDEYGRSSLFNCFFYIFPAVGQLSFYSEEHAARNCLV